MLRENLKSTCMGAVKVSVVVGTTLSLINQTQQIFSLTFTAESVIRIFLNYLVPFLVASYSRYALLIEQQKKDYVNMEKNRVTGRKKPEHNSRSDIKAGSKKAFAPEKTFS